MVRVFKITAALALAATLASGGFVGFLFGTGRLNGQRLGRIAAVLRGELDAPPAAPAPGPTTRPTDEGGRNQSTEEIHAVRQREHLEGLRLERGRRDLEAQQRLLEQALHHLLTGQEQLAQQQTAFTEERKQRDDSRRDGGFQRELEYFGGLSPKLAKEHLLRMWRTQKADAVRLFVELEPAKGKRILEQLKTPAELDVMHELLEQVRLQGDEGYAGRSGKTTSAAAP